ncbi:MAG: hypothetical protein ABI977_22075 [Acidobacteriota bacterium]
MSPLEAAKIIQRLDHDVDVQIVITGKAIVLEAMQGGTIEPSSTLQELTGALKANSAVINFLIERAFPNA